jgi:signal transduction histidine kinase
VSYQTIALIAAAVGLLLISVTTVFNTYLRLLDSREQRRQQRLQFDLELRKLELDTRRTADDLLSYSGSNFQLDKITRNFIVLDEYLKRESKCRAPTSPETSDRGDSASLIREISHSLNTPLSQIEVALKLLADSESLDGDDARAIERARSSVELCKSYIQGFRQAILAEGAEPEASDVSLEDILSNAIDADSVSVSIDIPKVVTGYENAFLAAMLLPLIENAVESALAGSTVAVRHDSNRETIAFEVASRTLNIIPDEPYAPGVTTKEGHDGMGLVVVKRLASSVPGGAVSHRKQGDEVTFTVTLPSHQ